MARVTRSLSMETEAFVQCRVPPQLKARLRDLADQRQITESALLRHLIEAMLQMTTTSEASDPAASERTVRNERLCVRLAPEDRVLLADRARYRGMPAATYISVLLRSHLRNLTPLPKEELLALKRSVAELGVIGRNLNQLARVAHQTGKVLGPGREDLRSMLRVAEGLHDHVKALLKANQAHWVQGYAATPTGP